MSLPTDVSMTTVASECSDVDVELTADVDCVALNSLVDVPVSTEIG